MKKLLLLLALPLSGCTAIVVPTANGQTASYFSLLTDRKIGRATATVNPDGSVTMELADVDTTIRDEAFLEAIKRIPSPD